MSMMVLRIGFDDYAVPVEDGLKLAEILMRAKRFEVKYINGAQSFHAYEHVNEIICRLISDEMYRIAALAGKPE